MGFRPLQRKSPEVNNYKRIEYQWQINKQGHLVYSNDENDRLIDSSLLKPFIGNKAFTDAVKEYREFTENPKKEKPVKVIEKAETENWDTKQKWWIRALKWLMR